MSEKAPVLNASRILNASRVAQAADDTPVTGWTKTDSFIVAFQLDETFGPWTAAYKIRWRDVDDAGSFADLAASGEMKWATDTDLVNGNAVVIGEKACTADPGGTWADGEEIEGDYLTESIALADEEYTEIHVAITGADGDDAHEYEFEIYDNTNSAAVGTALATLTLAAAPATVVLGASRIADADRVDRSHADDGDVVFWNKDKDFILATRIYTSAGPIASAYKLRWKNTSTGGSFADVGSTGEITYNATTVLGDDVDLAESDKLCDAEGGYAWQNGEENESDNLLPDSGTYSLADEYYTEFQWALDCSSADETSKYEFELYDDTQSSSVGTCAASITMSGAAWYDLAWKYRKKLAIQNGQVPANQTDFPVFINTTDVDWKHVDSGGHVEQSDGNDFLFTKDDGVTKLSHELEKYEYSTGELVAWVKVPTVSSTVDTDIYVYYGNPDCADLEDQSGVWDSNYKAVWHLCQDPDNHYAIENTATYDHFGFVIRTGPDTFLMVCRTGADHTGNDGKIVKISYDATTDTWGTYADVYNSAWDDRGPHGGMIGDDIYVFFTRYDDDTSTYKDSGYIKSSDGGGSWSSYTTISLAPLTNARVYGHLFKVGATWYIPFYGMDNSTYYSKLLKSTDGGSSWAVGPTIYSGAITYTEPCCDWAGGDNILCLTRKNAGGVLRQFRSPDAGESWVDDGDTNIGGASAINVPWLEIDGQRAIVMCVDRDADVLRVWEGVADDMLGNPTAWIGYWTILANLAGESGYPSVSKWKPNRYLVTVFDEAGSSDADLISQVYSWGLHTESTKFNIGTLANMDSTNMTSQLDGALIFNGSNEYGQQGGLDLLSFLQNTGVFTIEAWMKLDDNTADKIQAIAGNTAASAEKGFLLAFENRSGTGVRELRLLLYNGSGQIIDSRSSDDIITDNLWHHVVITGDGTNVTFYVDAGSDAGSGTMGTKSSGDSTRALNMARYNYSTPGGYLDGNLDEIRFSDIERDGDYVTTCKNNQTSPSTFYDVYDEQELGRGDPAVFVAAHRMRSRNILLRR